jgi:hypothetical protein
MSVDLQRLADTIRQRRAQGNAEPIAANEEVRQLKEVIIQRVKDGWETAALLLVEIYVHPNTPDIQRDFIRQIGYHEHDYGAVSAVSGMAHKLYADEPDTPTRQYKRRLLKLSLENGMMDPRDTSMTLTEFRSGKAAQDGVDFDALVAEIAPISSPPMAKMMRGEGTDLRAFDQYFKAKAEL